MEKLYISIISDFIKRSSQSKNVTSLQDIYNILMNNSGIFNSDSFGKQFLTNYLSSFEIFKSKFGHFFNDK